MPVLARMLREHPELRVDVRLSDQQCDLIREGLDAAVRIMPLEDSGLTFRQVDEQHLTLCASAAYLERRGLPVHPDQLPGHDFVVFRNPTSGRQRPVQLQLDGTMINLNPPYCVILDDGEALVQVARFGTGLIQVPDYMVAEELMRGNLVEVLPDFRPFPLPISVVWPGNAHAITTPGVYRCAGSTLPTKPCQTPNTGTQGAWQTGRRVDGCPLQGQ